MIISFLDIREFLVAKEVGELIVGGFFGALVDTPRSLGRDGPAVVVANATVAWCVFRGTHGSATETKRFFCPFEAAILA